MRGKVQRHNIPFCLEQDHPRLCGEKANDTATKAAGTGSPPPMRGKDRVKQYTADRVGITPAYAGKRVPR